MQKQSSAPFFYPVLFNRIYFEKKKGEKDVEEAVKMSHPTISLGSARKHFKFQLFSTTFPSEKTQIITLAKSLQSCFFAPKSSCLCLGEFVSLCGYSRSARKHLQVYLCVFNVAKCPRPRGSVTNIQKGQWTNCFPVLCHMLNRYHLPLKEKTKLTDDWTLLHGIEALAACNGGM